MSYRIISYRIISYHKEIEKAFQLYIFSETLDNINE